MSLPEKHFKKGKRRREFPICLLTHPKTGEVTKTAEPGGGNSASLSGEGLFMGRVRQRRKEAFEIRDVTPRGSRLSLGKPQPRRDAGSRLRHLSV